MQVLKHIAGSKCVVQLNGDAYIDARRDERYPTFSFIEVVCGGQVKKSINVHDDEAPEVIIEMMRRSQRGWGTLQ